MPIDHRTLITQGTRLARTAGRLYLLVVAMGAVVQVASHAGIRVLVPVGTAQRIPTPTSVSLTADLAVATILALVGAATYLLLRYIDRRRAGTPIVFAAVTAGMVLVNLAFHRVALLVAGGVGTTAGGSPRSGGLVVLLLDLHDRGYTITGVGFTLGLLALGHLAYRSSLFPRVVSTLLIVNLIVSWLIGLGWPGLPTIVHDVLAPHPVADLWLVAYLVTKGVPARRPDRLVPAGVTA